MPRFEQVHATHRRRRTEDVRDQPSDELRPAASGGSGPDIDELLERIDQVLSEATARALGRSTGIEPA